MSSTKDYTKTSNQDKAQFGDKDVNFDSDDNSFDDTKENSRDASLGEGEIKSQTLLSQIEELKDRMLRMAADFENAKRRHEQQLKEARDYSVTAFLKKIVNVMDVLEKATSYNRESISEELKNFLNGIQMVQNEIKKLFDDSGLVEIQASVGDKFNHDYHYAIKQETSSIYDNDTIIEVFQKGYMLKDRLIRPAMVSVAKDGE